MHVETQLLIQGDVDEVKYGRFVARETRRVQRLIDRGHRDFANVQDARAFAESYCTFYRHQFRTLIPVKPDDPRRAGSGKIPQQAP